jgi:hypothetical protein
VVLFSCCWWIVRPTASRIRRSTGPVAVGRVMVGAQSVKIGVER